MIWDTHAHLDDPAYTEDFEEVIAHMKSAGISRVTNVGCDLASSERSTQLAKDYDFIYAAIGIHPHSAETAVSYTHLTLPMNREV
ncbi:MAG TPA: hypothetical protein DD730_15035 [Desulfosporosinus sp.]|nr:hypothetical protein [Desulfosporosinus sp.]